MKLRVLHNNGKASLIDYQSYSPIAKSLTDENAQTIAHRVNVHDELVAALADCNKALSALGCDITGKSNVAEAARKARTALEKAKQ